MTFNEKIDLFMSTNNISDLKSLARKVDIPYTTLRDIYKKKSVENSRFSTMKKLSSYIGCTLDYLAYDDITNLNDIRDIGEIENEKKRRK